MLRGYSLSVVVSSVPLSYKLKPITRIIFQGPNYSSEHLLLASLGKPGHFLNTSSISHFLAVKYHSSQQNLTGKLDVNYSLISLSHLTYCFFKNPSTCSYAGQNSSWSMILHLVVPRYSLIGTTETT